MTEKAPVPAAPATATAKVDPGPLVLRGGPARATRFRRGTIVAIAGVGTTCLAGAVWLAFKPISFVSNGPAESRGQAAAKAPSDAFDGAPRSYAEVPKRSEEHTSELQSLMRISYAVFCLKKKNNIKEKNHQH